MDIQFITDAYGCIVYVVNYLLKGTKGVSNMMKNIMAKYNSGGNENIKSLLKEIGAHFLKDQKLSVQEAAYHLLGQKHHNCSTNSVFINSDPPDMRSRILKRLNTLLKINKTNPDSQDIYNENLIHKYSRRDKCINHLSLAEFASFYDFVGKNKNILSDSERESESDEELDERTVARFTQKSLPLCIHQNNGYWRLRAKEKIIRYAPFSISTDIKNYYRSLLLLFHPWNDEDEMALCHFAWVFIPE